MKEKRRKIGDDDHRQSFLEFSVKRSKEIGRLLAEKGGIKIFSISIISLFLLVTEQVTSFYQIKNAFLF